MSQPPSNCELKPLYDGSRGGQAINIINVIILPEVGTRTDAATVNTIAHLRTSSRIFEFSYNLQPTQNMVWASILQKANEFQELILQQPQLWQYPLVFIAHGFGGIIAKRTVVIFDDRYWDAKLNPIREALSGLVLISVPHLKYPPTEIWDRLNSVLKACPGHSRYQSQNQLSTVANVCAQFGEAYSDKPLLSVYEGKETRLTAGFYRSKRIFLVDRDFCETGIRGEVLLEIPGDHLEIGKVEADSEFGRHLRSFFDSVRSRQQQSLVSDSVVTQNVAHLRVNEDEMERDTWASTVSFIENEDSLQAAGGGPSLTVISRNVSNQATHGTYEEPGYDIIAAPALADQSRRPSVKLPCHLLHAYARNEDFSGRNDVLSQMDRVLLPSLQPEGQKSTSPRAFSLCGLGGVGKTQCALEYALSRKGEFDAVLWVYADTTSKLDESFSQISVALGLEKANKVGDRVVSRSLVMEWLSVPTKHLQPSVNEGRTAVEEVEAKWLMIFDNADDPTILADYWPSIGPGAIIVTSRDPLSRRYFPGDGIDLDPLAVDDAAALLRRLTEIDDSQEEVEASVEVAVRLGGLPLAVSLAAAAIVRQELTLQEFLRFYEAQPRAMDVRPVVLGSQEQYQHTLSTVWRLDSLDKPSSSLLRLLSVLDPDVIDESLLTEKLKRMPLDDYPRDQPAFNTARASLLKASLVKRNKKPPQLSIHRITQDFTRADTSPGELKKAFAAGIRVCMNAWPIPAIEVQWSTGTWPQSEIVVPHLLHLKGLWQRQPEILGDDDAGVKKDFADLCWRVAWYHVERGSISAEVHSLLSITHELCRSDESLALSNTYRMSLFARSTLAIYEIEPETSLKYAELLLELTKKQEESWDQVKSDNLGFAWNQHGRGLAISGKFDQAAESFRRAIELYGSWSEVSRNGFRVETAWDGLALCLIEKGKYGEAVDICLATIRYREERFGRNDADSMKAGLVYQELGQARLKQGRLDESFEAFETAGRKYLATSGPRYFRLGQIYFKLGEHYALRRQFQEANSYFTQALKIFEGRDCYKGERARVYFRQAQVYETMGDDQAKERSTILYSTADKLYREVVNSGILKVYGATLENPDYDKIASTFGR